MSTLGIDFGLRKVGLAKAAEGTPAVPLDVLSYRDESELMARLAAVCRRELITRVVVGIPLSLRGQSGGLSAGNALRFVARLREHLGITVVTHDERLSTREAARLRRGLRGGPEDAVAAMLMLQSWIDKNHPAPGGIP